MDVDSLIKNSEFVNKNKIIKGFKIAKHIRLASDWTGPKLGACIMYKNKVLSVGWNSSLETSMQRKYNRFRDFDPKTSKNNEHAEIRAIRNFIREYDLNTFDKNKLSIFVYRELKNGELAMARPCAACEMALRKIGIKHIFYTTNGGIRYEMFKSEK